MPKLDVFADCDRFKRPAELADGMEVRLLDKYSDRWMSTKGNGFYIDNDDDAANMDFRLEATDNPYQWRIVEVKSGQRLESVYGALMLMQPKNADTQTWRFEQEEDGCYRLQCVADGKFLSVSGGSQGAGSPIFMARPVSISKKELEDAIQGEMLDAAIEERTAEVNEAR